MSFSRELKDFSEGMGKGVDLVNKAADAKYRRALADQARGPTEAEKNAPGGFPDGGGVLPDGSAPSTSSSTPEGGIAVDIKGDPEAGKVLAFIRDHESGTENPYNRLVYGGPNKFANLTDMSIADVLKYQGGMTKAGHASSALGAYQFINSTLTGAVKDLKLDPNQKFDQATQDRLGYYLLQKRGWGDYKEGRLGKDQLMDNLAHEWAALPLASGKSVYQGDKAGNKAGVGRDAFAAIVPDFGQGKGGTAAAPSSPTSAASSGPPDTPDASRTAPVEGTVLPTPADMVGPVAGGAAAKEQAVNQATESSTPPAKTGNYFLDEDTRTKLDPNLSRVVERAARDNPGLFALNPLTKTFRTEAEQKEMVDKGWSKTMKSKHRENKAIDLVPINPATGQADPNYTPGYSKIEQAMRKAQKDEGVQQLDWGGNWKSFKDRPHWQVAQLEQQEIDAGGQAPGNPNAQVQPVMWAERGGVIPVPAYADGGGVNPAGDPDKYNPNRAYTQAVPATTGTTTTPRRIKLSGDSTAGSASAEPPAWRSWGSSGGSPTQQRVATARSDRAAAEAAATAAAAQQQPQNTGYQQQLADWEQKANNWTGGQTSFSNPYMIPAMQMNAFQKAGAMPAPGEGASSGDQALYMAYQQKYAPKAATTYRGNYGSGGGGSGHEAGGMVRLEEGGVIPEVGFERGGNVDPNRQRADARGEVYSATRDDKYWRSRQPTVGKSGRRDESGIRYTSVAGGQDRAPTRSMARPSGGGRSTGSGRSVSAGASEKQHKFDDLPDTAPRPSPRPGTELGPPLARAAGTPTAPYELRRAGGTPTLPYEPKNAPIGSIAGSSRVQPLARAAGTPTAGYEPKARAAGTPTAGYDRVQSGPFPARPEVHAPGITRAQIRANDIEPTGQNVSTPPQMDDIMTPPDPNRGRRPSLRIEQGDVQPGAWVNGQFVPIDTTAAPGQGFARGGKVSHKDTTSSARKGRSYSPTFQSSRAESAGYTTSSPGWRRDEDEPVLPTESSFPPAPKSSGGGSSSADSDTPTKPEGSDTTILEDRATRWRGSDYPIIEDRASRWGPGDYPLVPPHGREQATTRPDLIPPHGREQPTTTPVIVVPETAPPPDQLDVTVAPMDPGATGVPRYADGGVIDDPDQMAASPRAESAGYATSAPAPAVARPAPGATPARVAPAAAPAAASPATQSAAPPEPETPKADVQPTPRLLEDVANGIKGGARFLRSVFGLDGRGDGTLPTPESRQARSQGVRRFATGEGAATQEEINSIDDQVDPNRELDEGKRQLNRLANITQFYLERGQKDKAEAAAGSLLQYGANRFGRLGSLAAAAYKNGDIDKTVQYLEQAYKMIPDGADISVSVDREKGVLLATHTDANGKETVHQVQASELPGMLKQTMDKSAYWSGVFRMADPALARQRESQNFEVGKEREKRGYDAGVEAAKNARELQEKIDAEGRAGAAKIEEEKRAGAAKIEEEKRAGAAKVEEEKRAAARKLDEEKRSQARTIELKLIDAGIPAKPAAGDINIEKLSPLLASATAAEEALAADKENPDLQGARDQAVSRLFDEIKDPAKLEKLGWGTGQYKYVQKTAPAQIVDAQGKPMQTSGEPRKAADGKWYVKGANGKYIEVAPQAAAPAG